MAISQNLQTLATGFYNRRSLKQGSKSFTFPHKYNNSLKQETPATSTDPFMRRSKRQKPPPIELLASDFLCEIIHLILLRLPAKSLLRFKCVSKSWNALISEPHFIHSHHNHSTRRAQKILRHDGYTRSFWTMYSEDDENAHAQTSLHFPRNRIRNMSMLSSCDAFVMLKDRDVYYLWNPCVRRYTKFSYFFHSASFGRIIGYGIYYESSTYDYMVLVVHENRYSTYSVRNDSWGDSRMFAYSERWLTGSKSVDGTLYWIAKWRLDAAAAAGGVLPVPAAACDILCFDPKEDGFSMFPMPELLGDQYSYELQLTVLGGSLGLYYYFWHSHRMRIWVLRKGERAYHDRNCWETLMIIQNIPCSASPKPICYITESEVVLCGDGVGLLIYNVNEEKFLKVDGAPHTGFIKYVKIATYGDSMLLPGVTDDPKRKWLSSEKRQHTGTAARKTRK